MFEKFARAVGVKVEKRIKEPQPEVVPPASFISDRPPAAEVVEQHQGATVLVGGAAARSTADKEIRCATSIFSGAELEQQDSPGEEDQSFYENLFTTAISEVKLPQSVNATAAGPPAGYSLQPSMSSCASSKNLAPPSPNVLVFGPNVTYPPPSAKASTLAANSGALLLGAASSSSTVHLGADGPPGGGPVITTQKERGSTTQLAASSPPPQGTAKSVCSASPLASPQTKIISRRTSLLQPPSRSRHSSGRGSSDYFTTSHSPALVILSPQRNSLSNSSSPSKFGPNGQLITNSLGKTRSRTGYYATKASNSAAKMREVLGSKTPFDCFQEKNPQEINSGTTVTSSYKNSTSSLQLAMGSSSSTTTSSLFGSSALPLQSTTGPPSVINGDHLRAPVTSTGSTTSSKKTGPVQPPGLLSFDRPPRGLLARGQAKRVAGGPDEMNLPTTENIMTSAHQNLTSEGSPGEPSRIRKVAVAAPSNKRGTRASTSRGNKLNRALSDDDDSDFVEEDYLSSTLILRDEPDHAGLPLFRCSDCNFGSRSFRSIRAHLLEMKHMNVQGPFHHQIRAAIEICMANADREYEAFHAREQAIDDAFGKF
ncbi:unnamed protein product [Amoebophrya sp. A120]|nr:unnamed protein product [Amoebophrya sp. A120]|eukprot:GSA120T00020113001.1